MNPEDKTKNELLQELQQLQQENQALKALLLDENSGQYKAELNFSENENKFSSIFQTMASGCCFDEVIYEDGVAVDYRILDVNPAYEKILGIKRVDVIGKLASEIYKTDNIPFFDIYARVAETGVSESFESFFEPCGIYLKITTSRPAAGMFSNVFMDITQRILAEDTIREIETQYRNLANSDLALIWTSGTDKLCNYFNDPWLKFTGRTLTQEYGNGWAEGVHPDDFDNCLSIYIKAFDQRLPFEMEYRLRHASGEYRWLLDLGTPNYDSHNVFAGYIGHCFDITERKKIEEALRISEEKYRSIFDNVQDVFYQIDMEGKILEISPSIENIPEFKRLDLIGSSVFDLYNDPTDREKFLSELRIHGELKDYELTMRSYSGILKYVSINARLNYDHKGFPHHIDGALRDISERKQEEMTRQKLSEELLHFGRLAINRENRMIELKKEINNLLVEQGVAEKYNIYE